MHNQEDYEKVTKSPWYGFAKYIEIDMSYLIPNQHNPEKSLWAACLEQAFTLCNTQLGKKKHIRVGPNTMLHTMWEDVSSDETAWFTSKSTEVGSYLFICEVLDLDPEVTYREGLKLRERTKVINRQGRGPGKYCIADYIKEKPCLDSLEKAIF